MPTREQYFDLINEIENIRARLADLSAAQSPDPATQDALTRQLADLLAALDNLFRSEVPPPDHGVAQLVGLGPGAATTANVVRVSAGVVPYDETVTSERILATADLYYIYQHERLGVFRAILKLQELFKAGRVRLSSGPGALALYQYDRQRVLRHARQERLQAYRRVFGYTNSPPPPSARPNENFHVLFSNFNMQVARYFRDRRISEVVRPAGRDITFGSIAIVRRAGLDLRSNMKEYSYGHVNVLAAEVSQLLERAFQILGADDVRRLFGADNAWDSIEEILHRYLGEQIVASQRSRMGITGREVIRWLAEGHILTTGRVEFESLLLAIGEYSEEWLTSAESLGLASSAESARPRPVVPIQRSAIPA